jgi:hypothetical protein
MIIFLRFHHSTLNLQVLSLLIEIGFRAYQVASLRD